MPPKQNQRRRAPQRQQPQQQQAPQQAPQQSFAPQPQPQQGYDNEMRGALFQNADKMRGDTRPDYKGSCEINGVKYWIAGWKRLSKQNQVFVSLSFEPAETHQQNPQGNYNQNLLAGDDLPF